MRWGVIAVVLLLLTACQSPAPEPIIVTPSAPMDTPVPTVVETPAVAAEPTAAPVVEVTPVAPVADEGVYERPEEAGPSMQGYLQHFTDNVQNYRFAYKNDIWLVQGKNAKVVLFRVITNEFHAPFIDTLYFDFGKRTLIGVCEGRDTNIKRQCALQDAIGKKYAMPYVQFKIVLPEDWMREFQNLYTQVSDTPQLITDRETVHLKHAGRTRTTDMFIDPAIGLPLVVIDNDIEYHYDELAKNQFGSDSNVVPIG